MEQNSTFCVCVCVVIEQTSGAIYVFCQYTIQLDVFLFYKNNICQWHIVKLNYRSFFLSFFPITECYKY